MPGDQHPTRARGGRPKPADTHDGQRARFGDALRLARALYPANAGLPHTVDFPAPAR